MDPDGYLIVNVREMQLSHSGNSMHQEEHCRTYRHEFKGIRSWRKEPWGIQVVMKDGDVTGYPWNMIEQFYCKVNGDEYVAWAAEQDN